MSHYMGRIPRAVKAKSTDEMQKKLFDISIVLQQKVEIINIYESRNGPVVAWYFHDLKAGALPTAQPEAKPEPKVEPAAVATKSFFKKKKGKKK